MFHKLLIKQKKMVAWCESSTGHYGNYIRDHKKFKYCAFYLIMKSCFKR